MKIDEQSGFVASPRQGGRKPESGSERQRKSEKGKIARWMREAKELDEEEERMRREAREEVGRRGNLLGGISIGTRSVFRGNTA